METAVPSSSRCDAGPRPWLSVLHVHERIIFGFFLWLSLLGLIFPLSLPQRSFLLLLPAVQVLLCHLEERISRPWSRVLRQWSVFAFIPASYWCVEFFARRQGLVGHDAWISWDRFLLYDLSLKHLIEFAGPALPALVETAYLLLYALPPAALGIIYFCGGRARAPRFLLVLFLGTLAAYGLLPALQVSSPRLVYAGQDLPAFHSLARTVNLWVLDHLDISTSVFPSGHVAVAFSCAFGLLSALPRRRSIGWGALFVASLVFLATVYGRYHYAVDGLASLGIAASAWLAAGWLIPDAD